MKTYKLFFLCLLTFLPLAFSQVYTTYHWHLQQPIYWPETSSWNNNTYQKAYESMTSGGAHPENELDQIFGWADRVAAYQYRIRDAIGSIQQTDGGAQISYSGCLVENVESLANASSLGYYDGWENANREARNWLTSGGNRKLDIVIFPYHHALGPLVDEEALRKEIQIYKEIYPNIWGSGLSVGYFPAELSFSQRMIPVLVEEGIEWVFVPNNHLSRACENFPLTFGTGGEMCDPPNAADILNPPQSNWFSKTIQRGCTPTNAYPFAYQPHKAKYVNPETGQEYKITVVPVAQAMSWTDGYQQYGMDDINQIAWTTSASNPILVVLAHDGDNAYAGGYSYYMENVQQFCNAAAASGYSPIVVQQYLQDNPVSESDIVHVEDGSWINADGDFGSPDFINWNWPLFNQSGEFDIANGWAEDERNWAVITAGQNWVETAEQIAGGVNISQIQNPNSSASNAELAWHFFLPSLTSGYMYYGTALDMEVKPTIACNNAIEKANLVIGNGSQDQTPPTIWIPQQLPHNPGGTGFGSLWGYQVVEHSRDFWVWTFVSDVSGVAGVTFKYRIDNDGTNPLSSNQNETYVGGNEVGAWVSLPMQFRDFPAGNVYNNPEINFFEMPIEIADQYFIHIEEPAIVDEGGVLVDYFVEAVDNNGFIKRSPILHTFVGTGDGTSTDPNGSVVSWYPENPEAGNTISIYYDLNEGSLPDGTNPVKIHLGHSEWQEVISPDSAMNFDSSSSKWIFEYAIPSYATSVDFVFNDGQGNWDNNNGQDWHISVSGGGPNDDFVMDGSLDEGVQLIGSENGVNFYADWNDEQLYVACDPAENEDHFILISNGSSVMISAPWGKSGTVAQWQAYLANESTNGWSGWFDGGSQQVCGNVLEGVLNWNAEFGAMPESVFLAMGAYGTQDGGSLQFQIPLGNGDGNIDVSEFYELILKPGDLNSDGTIDLMDFAVFATHWMEINCNAVNNWCGGADLNHINNVDIEDIAKLASFWLD
jgi:Glycosyl hydrolase family 57